MTTAHSMLRAATVAGGVTVGLVLSGTVATAAPGDCAAELAQVGIAIEQSQFLGQRAETDRTNLLATLDDSEAKVAVDKYDDATAKLASISGKAIELAAAPKPKPRPTTSRSRCGRDRLHRASEDPRQPARRGRHLRRMGSSITDRAQRTGPRTAQMSISDVSPRRARTFGSMPKALLATIWSVRPVDPMNATWEIGPAGVVRQTPPPASGGPREATGARTRRQLAGDGHRTAPPTRGVVAGRKLCRLASSGITGIILGPTPAPQSAPFHVGFAVPGSTI